MAMENAQNVGVSLSGSRFLGAVHTIVPVVRESSTRKADVEHSIPRPAWAKELGLAPLLVGWHHLSHVP
jgi:hypothetical protein